MTRVTVRHILASLLISENRAQAIDISQGLCYNR